MERTSEINYFLFQTLHACRGEFQPFRLKLRLRRLWDPCCFAWKAVGERGKVGTVVHIFTREDVII